MKFLLGVLVLIGLGSQSIEAADVQASGAAGSPATMRWIEHEFLMPVSGAPRGIDVLQVEVERPGKHPLAILTHGTAADREDRARVTPWAFLPQAMWFARRGYVVLVVVRKGYGHAAWARAMQRGHSDEVISCSVIAVAWWAAVGVAVACLCRRRRSFAGSFSS